VVDESASKAENRARNAVLFVSWGTCRAKMTQLGGKFTGASDACCKRASPEASVTLSVGAVGIGAAGAVEQEAEAEDDAAMRPSRASRYSTYSACNASQRSFESVRNPALRASSSSADGSSSSPSALQLFSRVWYGK
jgi:hypothetical protein